MKPYELVVVLKATLGAEEKKKLISSIEDIIGKSSIKATDDMGILPSAYLLEGKRENSNIHIISYHVSIDSQLIITYNKKFSYLKGVIRNFFYAMTPNQEFVVYADLKKKLNEQLEPKEKTIS